MKRVMATFSLFVVWGVLSTAVAADPNAFARRTGAGLRSGKVNYYDRTGNGRMQERSRTSGKRTSYYDRTGRTTGYSRVQGKRTTFYDRSGRRTGSSRPSGSRTTFYDRSGKIVGRSDRRK